jgi:small GTP-binding protein
MNSIDKNYDLLVKTILIGETGVGKSTFCHRFINNNFILNHESTIGVDFFIKLLEINGKKYKLQIWDTAGQEKFRSIITSYFRNVNLAIIMIDINDENCLTHFKKWNTMIDHYCQSDNLKKIILGNKIDLGIKCNINDIYEIIGEIPFLQISVKNNTNINQVSNSIYNLIENFTSNYDIFDVIDLEDDIKSSKRFNKCC